MSNAHVADFSLNNIVTFVIGGTAVYSVVFGTAFFDRQAATNTRLMTAGPVPIVVVVAIGFALHSRHVAWDEGVRAFTAYTGRFPRNALGDPFLVSESSSVTTVCARQVRTEDTYFCVETITDPSPSTKAPGSSPAASGFASRMRTSTAGSRPT